VCPLEFYDGLDVSSRDIGLLKCRSFSDTQVGLVSFILFSRVDHPLLNPKESSMRRYLTFISNIGWGYGADHASIVPIPTVELLSSAGLCSLDPFQVDFL
jgi:hypothetical protein